MIIPSSLRLSSIDGISGFRDHAETCLSVLTGPLLNLDVESSDWSSFKLVYRRKRGTEVSRFVDI